MSLLRNYNIYRRIVMLTIGGLPYIILLTMFFTYYFSPRYFHTREVDYSPHKLEELKEELNDYILSLSEPPIGPAVGLDTIAVLTDSYWDCDNRISLIEEAISDNPSRALTIPLLQRDLKDLSERTDRELSALKLHVDRIYDQNKWFLGLMLTATLGMLTMALSSVFRSGRENERTIIQP